MRSYQEVGLTKKAKEWLKTNCNLDKKGTPIGTIYNQPTENDMGWCPCLKQYKTKTGIIIKEIVQCTPWSNGPMYFFCLQSESGEKLFEWKESKIKSLSK